MPICPKCSSKFHRGAEVQCPCCGYSLREANGIFGNRTLELARITDTAGILTHKERMALARFLERIERRIPPAALCVYVTDHGRLADFRTHAHWALNHARPRHETFGKRGRRQALEEPRILVRDPRAAREDEPAAPPSRLREWREELSESWHDLLHPVPPAVRPEWMLLLVMDVQLETACFAWGYMLDPYVDPNRINGAMMKHARQLFRERSTEKALELVMEGAARHLAARAHALKKRFSLERLWGRSALPALALAACLSQADGAVPLHDLPDLPSLPPPPSPAAAVPSSAPAAASEVQAPARHAASPEDTATAPSPGAPATQSPSTEEGQASPPSATSATEDSPYPEDWKAADRELLLLGSWWKNVEQLFPDREDEAAAPRIDRAATAHPLHEDDATAATLPESDSTVPEVYAPRYLRPESSGLLDPQNLMSETERSDLRRLLNLLHRNCRCRFYVALFGKNQKEPLSLSPQKLIVEIARLHERSVLLHYHLGDASSLRLAYDAEFMKELTDDQRRAWLRAVRDAAGSFTHGPDALDAALWALAEHVRPVAEALPERRVEESQLLQDDAAPLRSVSRVPISLDREAAPKKKDWRSRLREIPDDPAFIPLASVAGGAVALLGGLLWLLKVRRRNARLEESAADVRLSSPAGAGVSRVVHYMEGREAGGDARSVL